MNARYYNASQGQFISEDPVFWELGISQAGKQALSDPQSMNSYSYSRNNPILLKDPNGKFFQELFDNLIAGPRERYTAIQESIAQNSLQPLQTSFNNQFSGMLPQQGDNPEVANRKIIGLVMSVSGGVGEEGVISKNVGGIQITKERLGHVIEGHAWNTSLPDKSTFLKGVDPVKLINEASEIPGVLQKSSGNIQRIIIY